MDPAPWHVKHCFCTPESWWFARELKRKTCRCLVVFDEIFDLYVKNFYSESWLDGNCHPTETVDKDESVFLSHTHGNLTANISIRMGSKQSYGLMELNICTRRTCMNSFGFFGVSNCDLWICLLIHFGSQGVKGAQF